MYSSIQILHVNKILDDNINAHLLFVYLVSQIAVNFKFWLQYIYKL